ncbi:MAG: CBS domain-containing protein [Dehalococcoidia bacterium]
MSDGRNISGPPRSIAIDRGEGKPALIRCPECGAENIQGTDYCVNCNSDLRTLDIPTETPIPGQGPPGESVRTLGRTDPLTVDPGALIRDVITRMKDEDRGCAIVVEGRRVVGIFTERDVLHKVTPDREAMLALPVSTLMTADPVVMREDESVLVALNEMGVGGFRHLPLVNREGDLTAVLSGRDILAYIAQQAAR